MRTLPYQMPIIQTVNLHRYRKPTLIDKWRMGPMGIHLEAEVGVIITPHNNTDKSQVTNNTNSNNTRNKVTRRINTSRATNRNNRGNSPVIPT
jgi:hypothetical protein